MIGRLLGGEDDQSMAGYISVPDIRARRDGHRLQEKTGGQNSGDEQMEMGLEFVLVGHLTRQRR